MRRVRPDRRGGPGEDSTEGFMSKIEVFIPSLMESSDPIAGDAPTLGLCCGASLDVDGAVNELSGSARNGIFMTHTGMLQRGL